MLLLRTPFGVITAMVTIKGFRPWRFKVGGRNANLYRLALACSSPPRSLGSSALEVIDSSAGLLSFHAYMSCSFPYSQEGAWFFRTYACILTVYPLSTLRVGKISPAGYISF